MDDDSTPAERARSLRTMADVIDKLCDVPGVRLEGVPVGGGWFDHHDVKLLRDLADEIAPPPDSLLPFIVMWTRLREQMLDTWFVLMIPPGTVVDALQGTGLPWLIDPDAESPYLLWRPADIEIAQPAREVDVRPGQRVRIYTPHRHTGTVHSTPDGYIVLDVEGEGRRSIRVDSITSVDVLSAEYGAPDRS